MEDFGPYRIVRQIAVGGMAEIYLARERGLEGLERTVILKQILPHYSHDEEFVTMFLDEARLLAALSHPNITQVFGLGLIDETYYLVMEHVRGPTLGALLQSATRAGRQGLPEKQALGIALGIAEALAYVHDRQDDIGRPLNIVHRDLNPANVLVSYDGAVKLIDFGIAKNATKVYETRAGVIKGTFGYMAPEQHTRAAPIDHRADVFALGVLLYEMCIGKHPFDTSDEPSIFDRIVNARYLRPRQVSPGFPRPLDRLIASCLAPHPEGRPEDVRTLIRELAAYMSTQGFVVTMGDIAELAHSLMPDTEGAAPLPSFKSKQYSMNPAERIDGTQPVAAVRDPMMQNGAEEDDHHADEKTAARIPSPLLPSDHADSERTEVGQPKFHTEPTHPASGMARPEAVRAPARSDAARAAPRSSRVKLGSDSMMMLDEESYQAFRRPRRARSRSREKMVWALYGVTVAALATMIGFLTMRMLTDGPSTTMPSEKTTKVAENVPMKALVAETVAPVTKALQVVSDPPGARLTVDGTGAEQTTPTTVSVPQDRERVWMRVAKQGYVPSERAVSTAVGQAVFVLEPIPSEPVASTTITKAKSSREAKRRPRRPRRRR